MRSSGGARHDRLDLTTDTILANQPGCGVQVDGRCVADGPTTLGLFSNAFLSLRTQVVAVELSNTRHDSVQQHPRRCLIDLLRDRHELGTGFADSNENRDIIGPVTSQAIKLAIKLMHDHIRNRRLACVAVPPEQVLQSVSICRAGRCPRIDILADDIGAEFSRFTYAGFTLSWQLNTLQPLRRGAPAEKWRRGGREGRS